MSTEKKFRFPEGVFTEKEWVSRYADRLEEVKVDWRNLVDRRKWNGLSGFGAQERYEEALKKKAEKPQYRAWKGDTFQTISKATYLSGLHKRTEPRSPRRRLPLNAAENRPWRVRDRATQARYYFETRPEALAFVDDVSTSEITGEELSQWRNRLIVEKNQ